MSLATKTGALLAAALLPVYAFAIGSAPTEVPEPPSLAMFGLGAGVIVLIRYRSKKRRRD